MATEVRYCPMSQQRTSSFPSTSPPPVSVCVSTDVRVYRYDDGQSSANGSSSRVVIVTSLSAIVRERSSFNNLFTKDKEYISETTEGQSVSFDIYSHPIVRRSKKETQLNRRSVSMVVILSTISRMILLPHPGFTAEESVKVSQQKKAFVKPSKTWEIIRKSSKVKENQTHSSVQSQTTGSNKLSAQSNNMMSELNSLFGSEKDLDDLIESVPNEPRKQTRKNPRYSLSDSQILFQDERNRVFVCSPIDAADLNGHLKNKGLEGNPGGLEHGTMTTPVPARNTRNVSILHRPRTRDKASSTTSLNKHFNSMEENLGDSIKGALFPYISAGNYPSEIVLKLVTKKEIDDEMKKAEHNLEKKSLSNASEDNLLAPKLDDTVHGSKSKKKKKRGLVSRLICCWKSKKKDVDEDSNPENTKVYFPSIVEVRGEKKDNTSMANIDSDEYILGRSGAVDKKP